ncbi:MAG TPA: hypothetical protein VF723_07325 [Pyrinomonadaceae bacterium]|jgi:hypothetical protein
MRKSFIVGLILSVCLLLSLTVAPAGARQRGQMPGPGERATIQATASVQAEAPAARLNEPGAALFTRAEKSPATEKLPEASSYLHQLAIIQSRPNTLPPIRAVSAQTRHWSVRRTRTTTLQSAPYQALAVPPLLC